MNKKVIISLIVAILIVIFGIGIYFIIDDINKDNPIQNSKNLSDNEINNINNTIRKWIMKFMGNDIFLIYLDIVADLGYLPLIQSFIFL